jgi:hypothetical protein
VSRKQQLEAQIGALYGELNAIKDAEADALNGKLVGRCFSARNNYSCPEGPKDYWFLYTRVLRAEEGSLRVFQFQIDKDGRIEIEPDRFAMASTIERQNETSQKAFDAAWAKCLASVHAAGERKRR